MFNNNCRNCGSEAEDYGKQPLVINIDRAAKSNSNYRKALWTGKYFQVTLMSIPVGGDIGLEVHPGTDQFLRIESGTAMVEMGPSQRNLNYRQRANSLSAIIVPAGTWHNVKNIGNTPLKLYSVYAPPKHPFEATGKTKAIAEKDEND